MAVIKNRLKDRFMAIPNAIIEDSSLSHGAVRVYCYLSSKNSGWIIRNSDIKKRLGINQNQTMANYLKELVISGWIVREKATDEKGNFIGGFDYQINEKPYCGKSHIVEKPQCGKNHTLSNTELFSNTKLNSKTEKKKPSIKSKKKFIPPTENEVIDYFVEKGYTVESAKRSFNYYDVADWKDSNGKPVKNWKQKMISVWFKPENKFVVDENSFDINKYNS